MIRYVGLLRGINVGGNKKVSMGDLQAMVMLLGSTNVKTFLNSGNVVFDSLETNEKSLTKKLEETFAKTFGFESTFILRTQHQIQALVAADPFKGIKVTDNVRFYITFLANQQAGGSKSTLLLPHEVLGGKFKILQKIDHAIASVVWLSPGVGTTEGMSIIEKEYGKASTTRSWNTVKKIATL